MAKKQGVKRPNYRKLREQTSNVSFSMKIDLKTGGVTITFSDTGETESFYDYYSYLYDLSCYYRNRLDVQDDLDVKVNLCNNFINSLYLDMTDMQLRLVDKDRLYREVHIYIEQFEYFKKQYKEKIDLPKSGTSKAKYPSLNEKLLILHYLGVLNTLMNDIGTLDKTSKLLSLLMERSNDNVSHSISNIDQIKKKEAVKTPKTLAAVKNIFSEYQLTSIVKKIDADLAKIDKK